jgi:hypothetical protein
MQQNDETSTNPSEAMGSPGRPRRKRRPRESKRDLGIPSLALEWLREQQLFQAWCTELAEGTPPTEEDFESAVERFGPERIALELNSDAARMPFTLGSASAADGVPNRMWIRLLLWLEQIGRLDDWRAVELPLPEFVPEPLPEQHAEPVAARTVPLRCGEGPYSASVVAESLRIALLHPEDAAWAAGDRWAIIGALWIGSPHGYLDLGAMTQPTLEAALKQWRRARRSPMVVGREMTRQPASLKLAHLPEEPASLKQKYAAVRRLREENIGAPACLPDAWLEREAAKEASEADGEAARKALETDFKATGALRTDMPRRQRYDLMRLRDGQVERLVEAMTLAQLEEAKAGFSQDEGLWCEMSDLRPESPLDVALRGEAPAE